jgi:hypothetical protein
VTRPPPSPKPTTESQSLNTPKTPNQRARELAEPLCSHHLNSLPRQTHPDTKRKRNRLVITLHTLCKREIERERKAGVMQGELYGRRGSVAQRRRVSWRWWCGGSQGQAQAQGRAFKWGRGLGVMRNPCGVGEVYKEEGSRLTPPPSSPGQRGVAGRAGRTREGGREGGPEKGRRRRAGLKRDAGRDPRERSSRGRDGGNYSC